MKIFGQHIHRMIVLLLVAEWAVALSSFGISAYFLLPQHMSIPVVPGLIFSVAILFGLAAMGLYHARQRLGIEGVIVRLVVGFGVAGVLVAVLNFVWPLQVGRLLWGSSFTVALLLLICGRAVFWNLVDHDAFRRSVLVYGAGDRAANLLMLRRRSDRRGFRIAAFIATPGDKRRQDQALGVNVDGSLLKFALKHEVDEIVVAMDDRRRGFPLAEFLECKFVGIAVLDLAEFLERETAKLRTDLVNPSWLIFSDGFARKTVHHVLARALDVMVGGAIAVLVAPLMLAVAVAILIAEGPPVLYRQQRVGLRGKQFTLYKFRSMVNDAEAEGNPVWATTDDDRITPIGRLMRKTRIDELPQLLNVIRGDMSLVGPRPERPEFVAGLAKRIPYYHERHSVRPGITGWAQLHYPYGASEQDAMHKLQFDLYYIKHRSLVMYLVVLLQTIEVVLWRKGAR